MKRIVTSYKGPDLDGTSSMYAYSEYLNKIGIESDYFIYGIPKEEVEIVCKMFGIKLSGESKILPGQETVVVDSNNIIRLEFVNPEDVVEIIDHHAESESIKLCPKAKIDIEIIGAVATIIAEKFQKDNIPISRESAILLYYGIISNSINLKASITSKRDIEMTKWLKEQCSDIDENKIKIIFEEKSKIKDEDLRVEMEAEHPFPVGKYGTFTVAQLEIANVDEFLSKKKDDILSILRQVQEEREVNHIYINCVDILNGYTVMLTTKSETAGLLNEIFGFKFDKEYFKMNKIIQRKEMTRKLRELNNT